ncbi:MAG: hypothetical protein JWN00_5697 [Actinomycetia bacterium]|jgi:hypothetical protein|nr:hypothetical protein [Actinomycetes bacterium]
MHMMRIRERRRQRDLGLYAIGAWTRRTVAGGLALSAALGVAFAWTAPGHTAQASTPQTAGDNGPASAVAPPPVVTPSPSPSPAASKRRAKRHHPATARPAPVLQPPVRPVVPAPLPAKTTSGGS